MLIKSQKSIISHFYTGSLVDLHRKNIQIKKLIYLISQVCLFSIFTSIIKISITCKKWKSLIYGYQF